LPLAPRTPESHRKNGITMGKSHRTVAKLANQHHLHRLKQVAS
jgi:hypothetical protein